MHRTISSLKFQNLIYHPGDNIQLRTDINSPNSLYAKILAIVQAKDITNFPLVYVLWYEKGDIEGIEEAGVGKELVLTGNKDWQYI